VWQGSLAERLGVFMRKTKTQIAKFAAIAMLSVGAMTMSVSTVGAAVDLSARDLSAIKTIVSEHIAAAKANLPAGATEAQINAALAAAISSAAQQAIADGGSKVSAMLVAEAVITAAEDDHMPPTLIGTGMADAALAESNSTTSLEIADAVGATAPAGAIEAFQSTTTASGNALGQTLASAAASYENVGAGGRGAGGNSGANGNTQSFFGGNGGNGNGGTGGAGGGGGCRNPSCT
jgi:hypothetical protein